MTWDDLISITTARLRRHLACRHLDSWGTVRHCRILRMQHYWGARKAIRHIRDYRAAKASEAVNG